MTEYLLPVSCVLAGLAVGWIVAQALMARRLSAAESESAARGARADSAAAELAAVRAEGAAERVKNDELTSRAARAETDVAHLRERLDQEGARIVETETRLRTEFENLANRILEEKSVRFRDQNHEHLTKILDPLRQRIGEFRERVETIHTEEIKTAAALREQLGQLSEINQRMSGEATALTRALKGESKTQGLWGELILGRILEKSGLTEGAEYETQAHFRGADGDRYLPDVVIRLPDEKHLIVDAKVSLAAYERAMNEESGSAAYASNLREHTASVRRHIDDLSRKDYPGLPGLSSPDFVFLFVPVEPALHLALQQDPELYADAFDRNIVLVTPSTLLVALRAVESVWRRHKQTVNAIEIARQAGALHDQFVLFASSIEEIAQRLEQARAACDQATARLSTGRGNLVRRTLELQKLGARTEKKLSDELTQRALEDDSEGSGSSLAT